MTNVSIRLAQPEDAELVATLIRELALYEKLEHEARPSAEQLKKQLAADADALRVYCLIAEVAGKVAGYAIYLPRYSTFETNWGIHLEDIFVREAYRSQGVGKMLFQELASIAQTHGCKRLELNVLNWNEDAIGFYSRLGGVPTKDWHTIRFEEDAIKTLAVRHLA